MGVVFNQYSNDLLDSVELETKISTLMADKEVTKKSGLYEYLLSGREKYLNLRQFDDEDTRAAYEHQKRVCPICGKRNDYEKIHAYHITSWHAAGSIILENI